MDMTEDTDSNNTDIIQLILRDHKPLKEWIQTLKNALKDRSDAQGYFDAFAPALLAHAKAEEKSLYYKMKDYEFLRMESLEGETEHAIAESLIHEINATPDDTEWCAKVKVLTELVDHHIKEEETEILKQVEAQMDSQARRNVGNLYMAMKTEIDLLHRPLRHSLQNGFDQRWV